MLFSKISGILLSISEIQLYISGTSLTSSEIEKYLTTDFMPVSTDSTVSSAATDGTISSLKITGGSGYTDGTYYAAIYGDGTSQGTSLEL